MKIKENFAKLHESNFFSFYKHEQSNQATNTCRNKQLYTTKAENKFMKYSHR